MPINVADIYDLITRAAAKAQETGKTEETSAVLFRDVIDTTGLEPEIARILAQLPDAFFPKEVPGGGGGHSFLAACEDRDGRHWGEHMHIDGLLALGLAANMVHFCAPRDIWSILPGGMPYFVVSPAVREVAHG